MINKSFDSRAINRYAAAATTVTIKNVTFLILYPNPKTSFLQPEFQFKVFVQVQSRLFQLQCQLFYFPAELSTSPAQQMKRDTVE